LIHSGGTRRIEQETSTAGGQTRSKEAKESGSIHSHFCGALTTKEFATSTSFNLQAGLATSTSSNFKAGHSSTSNFEAGALRNDFQRSTRNRLFSVLVTDRRLHHNPNSKPTLTSDQDTVSAVSLTLPHVASFRSI